MVSIYGSKNAPVSLKIGTSQGFRFKKYTMDIDSKASGGAQKCSKIILKPEEKLSV